MKNKLFSFPILLFSILQISGYQHKITGEKKAGTVKITFINTVKGEPIHLNTASYTNPFGEAYAISKFKYYISNVSFAFAGGVIHEDESYHLVDESKADALHFSFPVNAGSYHALSFMLGVDSIKNVSGAQTGALDPLNDMFWTWNSGYIMLKIEGNSPQSKLVNNKVEFHIGGFSGPDNVLKNLTLNFPAGMELNIKEDKLSGIIVEADLDKLWQSPNDLKITEHPVCSTPGPLAKKFADNYSNMFTIKRVINN
jgi:hypothetical protein